MNTNAPLLRLLTCLCSVLIFVPATHSQDISSYGVLKGIDFRQIGTNKPALVSTGAFKFVAFANKAPSGEINGVTVRVGPKPPLTLSNLVQEFRLQRQFNALSNLDVAFPSTNYTFNFNAVNDGSNSSSLRLSTNAYPVLPVISNLAAAQVIEATNDFWLWWNSFGSGATNDYITLEIASPDGQIVWQTNTVPPTATSLAIPGATLGYDQQYTGSLAFVNVTTANATNYPGVAGFFRRTHFLLKTLPAPPAEGRLQFSTNRFRANENAGTAEFTVTRTGGSANAVSVEFATANGTAQGGLDYVTTVGPLNFADGETEHTFTFSLLDDFKLEGGETVQMALRDPQNGAVLGPISNAVMTIIDNETASAGTLQFSVGNYATVETNRPAALRVVRTGGAAGTVTVDFSTVPVTAGPGSDYVETNGTAVFGPGVTNGVIQVPILDNFVVNSNKTLRVQLGNPSGGAALGDRTNALLTILNNDLGGTVAFLKPAFASSETNEFATITVTRTNGAAGDVSIDFSTANGSAIDGVDYVGTNGTLQFAAGESVKSFQVQLIDNELAESNKTVRLMLTNATGGLVLGTPKTVALTIVDNEISLQFNAWNYGVKESNLVASLPVLRIGPTNSTVSVSYTTQDDNATAGTDYTARSGTLSFAPGIKTKFITIPITNDSKFEDTERINVSLFDPVGAQLGTRRGAVVSIIDDDRPASATLSGIVFKGPVSGAVVTFFVIGPNGVLVPIGNAVTTGTGGGFSLNFPPPAGPILAVARGGSFVNEVDGSVVQIGTNQTMRAVLPPGVTRGVISPLTEWAASQALAAMTNGVNPAIAVNAANAGVGQQYNLPNIIGIQPVDVSNTNLVQTANRDQRNYGLVLAGLAQLAANMNVPVMNLVNALSLDARDGQLDGKNGSTTITLTNSVGETITLPATAGTVDLRNAVQQFMNSIRNQSSLPEVSLPITATPIGLNVPGGFYITSTALPAWKELQAGSVRLTASGGVPGYTWAAVSGMPGWLTLSADGVLSGTAPILGSGTTMFITPPFTVQVTDAAGNVKTIELRITIVRAGPTITVNTLPHAKVGVHYSQVAATASGGTEPYYYTLATGSGFPPIGIILAPNGVLSGTPSTPGTYKFGITAVDLVGSTSTKMTTLIVDPPDLSIANAGKIEGNSGSTALQFNVTLSGASTKNITVNYATINGSAAAGSDFGYTSGTLTFSPGQQSKTISVPVFGDTAAETDETFTVSLSSVVGAVISRGQAVGTIIDDDDRRVYRGSAGNYGVALGTVSGCGSSTSLSLDGPISFTVYEESNGKRKATVGGWVYSPDYSSLFYQWTGYITWNGTAFVGDLVRTDNPARPKLTMTARRTPDGNYLASGAVPFTYYIYKLDGSCTGPLMTFNYQVNNLVLRP